MGARELVDRAFSEGLLSDKIHGATPHKTMHARLSVDIVQHGAASRFVRTKRGVYFLRTLLDEEISETEVPSILTGQDKSGLRVPVYNAPRRRPPPPSERVLVIPRDACTNILEFQGIKSDEKAILLQRMLALPGVEYRDRSVAEDDLRYKQVVTYVLVVKQGAILAFRRGDYSRAAAFLRGNRCIGFGGHVTEGDVSLFNLKDAGVGACAWRELHEEVALVGGGGPIPPQDGSCGQLRLLGILNDDSSIVGQKHVAIVYEYNVDGNPAWETIRRGEAAVNQLGWLDFSEGASGLDLNEYEYWSQLCLRVFFPGLVKGLPRFRVIDAAPFTVETPHIVAVVGSIGSGKSVATRVLAEQFDYGVVESGRVLAGLLGIPPIPESPRDVFQSLASAFIGEASGPHRLARALLDEADRLRMPNVVVDGIRQRATLHDLRTISRAVDPGGRGRTVATLFVHAAPDVAYRFYRSREAARISTAEFMQLYTAPVESEVPFLISEADAILYNWSGRTAYDRAIRDLMGAIRGRARNGKVDGVARRAHA